jgi:hypothetical protein
MKTTKKRRMSNMRHSKKMIRKSRKMRGGGLWNWITGKKEEEQPPKYDNIINLSPEYKQQMKENMNKYNLQQQMKENMNKYNEQQQEQQ